ncbi:cytochrome P450 3A9-like [Elgaria multicarinata webbii]|uniref:cytochrome P450 3A9-like n=1 Tax=Elgaria multicarinata webbii TaxID=159646 RepID=UPI002FCD1DFD
MELLPSFSFGTWSLLIALLGLVMLYGIWPHSVFKKLGIPGPTPLPFFGTLLGYREGLIQFDTKCSEKYGKVWGLYDGRQAVLAVLDPIIIKAILVKECYTTFTNRRSLKVAGVFKHILPRTEDEQWKRIRTVLSPTFTSGKLKEMFPIIKHYGEVLMRNVQRKMENGETLAVKDIFGTYSLDVITSTSFGVNLDSMNNPKDPFVKHIKNLTKFKPLIPLNVLITVFPFLTPLLRALNLNILPQDAETFFMRSFAKIKETRLKEGEGSRVDFLQLMIDSQGSDGSQQSNGMDHLYKGLTDTEILAQSLIFVFAGYEPTSNSLSFMAYVLATHPDIQQKLQNEIDSILPNKAPLTYDAIRQLEYLDMVLSETQRLYPLGGRIERVCKKDVEINGVTIPKGMVVIIPPYVLHRNPEYWPQPEVFRPERFSKDNRETMDPYTYLPFGAGPRNCIGMRFALVAIKVAMATLLQHFSFRVCKETQIPLKMSNKIFLIPEKPIVLKLVPRNGSQEKDE